MAANGEDFSAAEAETSFEVHLYIYDLSKELSKSFKKILKGKPLPDFWHTGLVAYGREYYFASSGIESCRPGETILGEPDQILTLGKTELPYSVFLEYIFALGESSYKPGTYNLLEHNCNSFSQEVSNFLTGGPIPQELRELPNEILGNKTLSNTLKEYFDKLCLRAEGSKGISFANINRRHLNLDQEIPRESNGEILVNGQQSQPPTKGNKHHSKKEQEPESEGGQKKSKMPSVNGVAPPNKENPNQAENVPMQSESTNAAAAISTSEIPPTKTSVAEAAQASAQATVDNGQQLNEVTQRPGNSDRSPEEEPPLPTFTSRRSRKYPDPAIIFPEVDGIGSYQRIMDTVGQQLSIEERQSMGEILEYLTSAEGGAWALGTPHLDAIGRLLNDRNLPEEIPVLALKVLEAAALKDDVILLLHQDREHHHIMSYLFRTENLPEDEQEHIATFMCNLCCNSSSFDWLMYISEWLEEDGRSCNNSRVTVRVAVHSLLSEKPSIQDKGSALIFNLALKELFDDVATELAMAVLQFLQSELSEEMAFRSLTALFRFMCISYNDVPALMKMLGPDVRKFNGLSERVDQLVDQIQTKLNVTICA